MNRKLFKMIGLLFIAHLAWAEPRMHFYQQKLNGSSNGQKDYKFKWEKDSINKNRADYQKDIQQQRTYKQVSTTKKIKQNPQFEVQQVKSGSTIENSAPISHLELEKSHEKIKPSRDIANEKRDSH